MFEAIYHRVARDNVGKVDELLRDNLEHIDRQVGYYRATLLHWAVWHDSEKVVTFLIGAGADVNARTKSGKSSYFIGECTPLHVAAQRGLTRHAQVLLSNGADVDAGAEHDETPLHEAAGAVDGRLHSGNLDVARLLIDHGADIEAEDDQGRTAIFDAVAARHRSIAELLIAKGADLHKTDKYGKTPLAFALEYHLADMRKLLEEDDTE